ncbi:MAG: hypothetical protein IKP64_00600 [Selenomonadaceae bacterium]|nr:hypothetical protein [Selenomonadaceae bacterium]MBR4382036.1 hypothetical protein [Selenomonadaceae bacterium]
MIKSAYFPDTARCFAEDTDNKVEVPADIYDAAVAQGTVTNDLILRGDFTYETAKIFAQSGYVDALEFDDTSGEIKTSGTASVSAEINFAFAVWNGYSREAAVERAILAQLVTNANSLPEILSNKVSRININDGFKVETDFAKDIVGNSIGYVAEDFQSDDTIDVTNSVEVSENSQALRTVKNFLSSIQDEAIFLFKNKNDIADLFNGRISFKQFVKNVTITTAGMVSSSVFGATEFYSSGGNPFLAADAAQVGRVIGMELTKNFLDKFIDDDDKKLSAMLGDELSEMLSGKFLTQYEMEILMELLHDEINKGALKKMFASGNDTARTAWARNFLTEELKKIFGQRIFVERPSPDEWQAGLQRVLKSLDDGEDIIENMKRQRAEALAKRRKFFGAYGLKLYETAAIVQTVNDTAKTQLAAERTLGRIQADNRRYETKHQQQLDERVALKNLLNGRR